MSLRIDFVITELMVGGAERCLTELACGLAAGGDRVRVFSLGKLPGEDRGQLLDRLAAADIPVASGQARGLASLPSCLRRLRRWLAEDPSDLCQTFLFHANVLGAWAARQTGIPRCVGGLRVAEPNWRRSLIERAAVRRMDRLVCVSRAVASFATERLGADPARISVIPNGVDVTRFDAAEPFRWDRLGWPADAAVSLFVGRLHPQKGLERLQRHVDRLAPPDSNRKLLLVGDGPLAEPLAEWCRQLGGDRVRLLGWQSDAAPLMKACRLLVLPSHYEGMPNVVLETMACGRPVVCSRVEGSDELLAHDLERQSFPPHDDGAMADRAARLLDDPQLADAIGRANRLQVAERFSLSAMVEAYREVYRDLVVRREETGRTGAGSTDGA